MSAVEDLQFDDFVHHAVFAEKSQKVSILHPQVLLPPKSDNFPPRNYDLYLRSYLASTENEDFSQK